MDSTNFFKKLYTNCERGFISLTLLPERKTLWFKASETQKAALKAENTGKNTNTFFGVGLRKEVLPHNLRGGDEDVFAITALWSDIDVQGKAHVQKDLPISMDEAVNFVESLTLKPSIIVGSGNGLHAYWLLDTPYFIETREDRENISSILKNWGKYVNTEAGKKGWKLDTVSDLARILRVPGTINHKTEEKHRCEIIKNEDFRYNIQKFTDGDFAVSKKCAKSDIIPSLCGDSEKIIEKCTFIKYCKEHASKLPEPYWHAMITNLCLTKNGVEKIHELSKPYAKYSETETNEKIKRAIRESKPHTCEYIKNSLCFKCPQNCPVKAPVVLGIPSIGDKVKTLISGEFEGVSDILSSEVISLCAYAKEKMPAEYAKLKAKFKGKVNLRDFEKAVKHEMRSRKSSELEPSNHTVRLNGFNLYQVINPPGWHVSLEGGIQRLSSLGEPSLICPSVLLISKRFENIDTGIESVEISFFRNGRWKNVFASRSSVFNRNSIIKYADSGLPISSCSAGEIVRYLSEYESVNIKNIPLVKSISRIGWVKNEFFPYSISGEVKFETALKEESDIAESMREKGDFNTWKNYASKVRENMFARFLMSASFASPLLEKLNHRVFFTHIWHDSRSGKTAAIKMGVSVWGNPAKLMGSFNATSVGLERMAGILKHLPFVIDELQVANEKRASIENIVYSLGNGFGRIRGAKDGGIQSMTEWKNIIITSGEQPITKESSADGVLTRVLELYGKPVPDSDFAHEIHMVSQNNYGSAGKAFIDYLIKNILSKGVKLFSDYNSLREEIKKLYLKENISISAMQLDNISIISLGDYYSSVSVFKIDERSAWLDAIKLGANIIGNNKQLEVDDTIARAWEFVKGWIVANRARFTNDAVPCYGSIEEEKYYIIPSFLRLSLEENGFNYSKVTRGFKERGFFESNIDSEGVNRMQIQKRINGISCKVFIAKIKGCIKKARPL